MPWQNQHRQVRSSQAQLLKCLCAFAMILISCERVKPPPNLEATARDPLAFVPTDSTMIIGVDVAKLRSTPLWRDHFEPALRKFPSAATHINPDCDVDPITDIDRLTAAQRGVGGPRITFVIDGVDITKKLLCLGPELKFREGVKFSPEDAARLGTEAATGLIYSLRRATPSALVVDLTLDNTPGQIRALTQDVPLRSVPAFMDVFNHLPTSSTAWMIVDLTKGDYAPAGEKMKATYFAMTLTVTDHIELTADAYLANENVASKLTAIWEKDLAEWRPLVDRLEVRALGTTMHVEASGTVQQVNAIAAQQGVNISL